MEGFWALTRQLLQSQSAVSNTLFNSFMLQTFHFNLSIPARVVPFVVGVVMNDDEVAGITDLDTNEQDTAPGGIIGFHLYYAQSC